MVPHVFDSLVYRGINLLIRHTLDASSSSIDTVEEVTESLRPRRASQTRSYHVPLPDFHANDFVIAERAP